MTTAQLPTRHASILGRPLIVLGALWLLLAALVAVTQLLQPSPITIEWRTETEVNAAGFNLYRAPAADGPYQKINDQLIPGEGSASDGASYVYTDHAIQPGQTYFYQLEDVELDNSVTRHPSIQVTAPRFPWWLPGLLVVTIVIGVLLIWRGGRRERPA
ncbi:MAG TPA: hypothetical protein VE553_04990 [Candidatus Binatia bacterium]|nr:hypothetical protein [Candidatus Binatia bacterium]